MEPDVHTPVLYAVFALIGLLLTVIGFFLSQILKKIDNTAAQVNHLDIKFAVMESKWDAKMDDVAVLKRDVTGIYRQLDFLKGKLGVSVDATR